MRPAEVGPAVAVQILIVAATQPAELPHWERRPVGKPVMFPPTPSRSHDGIQILMTPPRAVSIICCRLPSAATSDFSTSETLT